MQRLRGGDPWACLKTREVHVLEGSGGKVYRTRLEWRPEPAQSGLSSNNEVYFYKAAETIITLPGSSTF